MRGREGARGRRDGEGGDVGCGEERGLNGGRGWWWWFECHFFPAQLKIAAISKPFELEG